MPVNMNSQPTRIAVHCENCDFFILNNTSANVMLVSLGLGVFFFCVSGVGRGRGLWGVQSVPQQCDEAVD